MIVEVKLFAVAKQLAAAEVVKLELSEGANIGQLREALIAQVPALKQIAPMLLFAVNHDYASDEFVLPVEADVACIPPVSGG